MQVSQYFIGTPLSDQSDDTSVNMGEEKGICPSCSQTLCWDISRGGSEAGVKDSDTVTNEHCDSRGCGLFSLVARCINDSGKGVPLWAPFYWRLMTHHIIMLTRQSGLLPLHESPMISLQKPFFWSVKVKDKKVAQRNSLSEAVSKSRRRGHLNTGYRLTKTPMEKLPQKHLFFVILV